MTRTRPPVVFRPGRLTGPDGLPLPPDWGRRPAVAAVFGRVLAAAERAELERELAERDAAESTSRERRTAS